MRPPKETVTTLRRWKRCIRSVQMIMTLLVLLFGLAQLLAAAAYVQRPLYAYLSLRLEILCEWWFSAKSSAVLAWQPLEMAVRSTRSLMRKGEGGKLSGDSQVYRAPTSYLSRELPVGQDYRWPQCSVVYPKKSEFGYYTTKY